MHRKDAAEGQPHRDATLPDPNPHNSTPPDLQTVVRSLEMSIVELEAERDRLRTQRRRNLTFVVICVSLLIHIGLMYYLNSAYRYRPAGPGPAPMTLEFNVINEEELTEYEAVEFDDLMPESLTDLEEMPVDDASADLEATVSAADLDLSTSGAVPILGGVGDGDSGAPGLSGGGAGTSFFGVSSQGSRFAYIVDVSGSMREGRKLEVAMRELARSISSLPDYAQFHVLLFSTSYVEPPMQNGWMRARRSTVNAFTGWLERVTPSGGTLPMEAFVHAFSLSTRPDVIFFLTDGEIPGTTADEVAQLNQRGQRVVINTIAFGDPTSQEQLKRIATDSGGAYRFVPSR